MEGHFAVLEKSVDGYFVEEIVICNSIAMMKAFLSFFVSSFWFLRGSRARIISVKKMIETL